MEKEFVTYELALKMKQIGFDEPCFMYYTYNGDLYKSNPYGISAPTYSQAFRWFREKHQLHISIDAGISGYYGHLKINPIGTLSSQVKQEWINTEEYPFKTYEEAVSASLDKLIEICKTK